MAPKPWKDPAIETLELLRGLAAGQKRLEAAVKTLNTRMKTMADDLNTEEAALAADDAALKASVDKAVARLTDLGNQLAAALEAAKTAGATPEQLAALTALHADLTADAAALDKASGADTVSG